MRTLHPATPRPDDTGSVHRSHRRHPRGAPWIVCIGLASTGLSAQAEQCTRWSFSRHTVFSQSDGAHVRCVLKNRSGTVFAGNCIHKAAGGEAEVFIRQGRFSMTIQWATGPRGIYTGYIPTPRRGESGSILDGRVFDEHKPSNWATFRIQRHMLTCLAFR